MRAIVNTGPGRVAMVQAPAPEPGPGQVRVRTAACGVCATDLEMIAGWERTGFGCIPGHEWSGTVDAVGAGVDARMAGWPCVAENVLADGGEVGFEHPGGYGEFLLTEARNLYELPAGFPLSVAALIEPLAVGVRAVRRLRLQDGRGAVVFGDGPIGLILLMLLKRAGVERIVVVGGRPARLRLAAEMGASATVNYHEAGGDLAAAVRRAAGEPLLALEASGSTAAMDVCLNAVAGGGKVLVIGDYGSARAEFRWNHLLHRELELIGSNASAGAWPEAVRLATGGEVPLGRLLTHRLPVERYEEAIELVGGRRPDVIKVVLEWGAGQAGAARTVTGDA